MVRAEDGWEVFILEGLFVFSPEAGLREQLCKKIFVECDEETALQRRIARKVFPEEVVRKQWSSFVQPGFETYIRPSAGIADLTVPNTEAGSIDRLMQGIRADRKWQLASSIHGVTRFEDRRSGYRPSPQMLKRRGRSSDDVEDESPT